MREYTGQIIKTKWLFLMHMIIYAVLVLSNALILLGGSSELTGDFSANRIRFVILFLSMMVVEAATFLGARNKLKYTKGEFFYRVFQTGILFVFYLMLRDGVGSGLIILAILLFYAELIFFFQPDDRGRRIMMYTCIVIATEVVTFWYMLHITGIYEGLHILLTVNLLLFGMLVFGEAFFHTYDYFVQKLLEQNRTVESLNEANDKLKEQKNEIRKTNERLGMQKIELQAANAKINRSHDEMSLQNEIASIIASTMEQDELLERICKVVKVRLDMDLVCVIVQPDREWDVPGIEPPGQSIYCSHVFDTMYTQELEEFISSGKVEELLSLTETYVQNVASLDAIRNNREEKTCMQSLMIIPLKKHSECIGRFVVGKRQKDALMEYRTFYETIASQICLGITNIRLYEQMRQMAMRDGLTRIYNRRYLTEVLNEYLKESMEKRTEVCLALFDIDKFKMVNDTYGHLCGDLVIRQVAALLNQTAYFHGGVAGRYGGEEFVIAFQNQSLAQVYQIIKQVHEQIRREEIHYEDKVLHVCVSVGLASYPETCKNPSELLNRADWAMYHSKKNGRDQITVDRDSLETKM